MRYGLILVAFLLTGVLPAAAQTGPAADAPVAEGVAPALPDPLTPEAIRDRVSTLSDAEARLLLVEVLDGLAVQGTTAKVDAAPTGTITAIATAATGMAASFLDMLQKGPNVIGGLSTAFRSFVATYGWERIGTMFTVLAAAILLGAAAEYGVNRLVARWQDRVDRSRMPDSLTELLSILILRLFIDLGGVIIFFVVLRLFNGAFMPTELLPVVHDFVLLVVVVPRVAHDTTKLLVSPRNPQWRLVNVDDWTAVFLMRQLVGVIAFMGFGAFLTSFQLDHGVPPEATKFGAWVTMITFLWFGSFVWRGRVGIRQMMAGWDKDLSPAERAYAQLFPGLLIGTMAVMWLLGTYLSSIGRFDLLVGGSLYITVLLFGYQPIYDTAIRALARYFVPPIRGEGELAERAWAATRRAYIRMGRVLVFGLIVLTLARIWNIDLTSVAAAGVGDRFAANLIQALVILATGYFVLELTTAWINRNLANASTGEDAPQIDEGDGGGGAGSRLATVLPLIKLILRAAIVVMTVLLALGQLGIDTTPLLAGAGIAGLAIGFGAQTLVKDIVSGLFFLIDDAFRVGEYIMVGATEGTVEKISVRSLQLRHTEGLVHTIPYGEIAQVTNASRDWVLVKMKFTVPFETDLGKVKKIFKTIGAELLSGPYASDILQTFKLIGVGDVTDVGLVIRGKFMAKPGRQWLARRDIYNRIQQLFAEHGIEFARREVRVNIGGGHLDDATRVQVAQAAAEAVQPDEGTPGVR